MSYNNYQQYGNPYGGGQQPPIVNSGFNPYAQFQPQPQAQPQPSMPAQQSPAAPVSAPTNQPIGQLSFLTAEEQQKYYTLFTHSTNSVSITPDSARSILLKSNLTPHQLAKIWDLSDLNKSGDLLFPEFALALYLCNTVLKGGDLPYVLNDRVLKEVTGAVDKINFAVPEEDSNSAALAGGVNPLTRSTTEEIKDVFNQSILPTASTGAMANLNTFQPQSAFGLQTQQTGYVQTPPQPQQQPQTNSYDQPSSTIQSQPTGFGFQNQQQTGYQQTLVPQATNTTSNTGFNNATPQFFTSPQKPQDPIKPQFTGFQQTQPTGNNYSSIDTTLGLNSQQATGGQTLRAQLTGGAPLRPLQPQFTQNEQQQQQEPIRTQLTGGAPLSQPIEPQATTSTAFKGNLAPTITGSATAKPLTQQTTAGNLVPLQSVTTGSIAPITAQPTGTLIPLLKPQATGYVIKPLTQQKTGVGQNSFFIDSLLQAQAQQQEQLQQEENNKVQVAAMYSNATITADEKKLFNKIFDNFDTAHKGLLDAKTSSEIFRKSGLNREDLEKIWDLITRANQTHLDKESFQLGMWLVYRRINGAQLPETIPEGLKPSSLKILDSVKKTLKTESSGNLTGLKKSSMSKMDGSRFKNNDDELIISASRHRRRNTSTFTGDAAAAAATDSATDSPVPATATANAELSSEEIKKKIWEKKILLDDLKAQAESQASQDQQFEQEDLRVIDELKRQIQSLPQQANKVSESEQLKSRLDTLLIQVPQLNTQISQLNEQIKSSKIQLFQLQNPVTVAPPITSKYLKGTGPNGEITDFDRRKFEKRKELAVKMAQLTGKPLDPEFDISLDQLSSNSAGDDDKLKEYTDHLNSENETNTKMIKEIIESITDLAKSVGKTLKPGFSTTADESNYKKFELGVGVQPEVAEVVKALKVAQLSDKFANVLSLSSSTPSPSLSSSEATQPQQATYSSMSFDSRDTTPTPAPAAISSPTITSSGAHPLTAEERRAQIRARVQERIKSKYTTLTGRSPTNSRTPSGNSTPTLQNMSPTFTSPAPVPAMDPTSTNHNESSSDDDDDEEEFQRMEEIRRLKRMERDARLTADENRE
ncbi:hypothetical protein WICPIJ_005949 [Wickerhamomyces pijperi]|uniref:EH domain-containing protein n=1 Tax=Wickerhamomyces pijperi TaxID=599730 RepID=A0A9P8TLV1_WICPI|nr:hypothetical protein WICPIJ_005949 [Wickerhamomyces pijperi]